MVLIIGVRQDLMPILNFNWPNWKRNIKPIYPQIWGLTCGFSIRGTFINRGKGLIRSSNCFLNIRFVFPVFFFFLSLSLFFFVSPSLPLSLTPSLPPSQLFLNLEPETIEVSYKTKIAFANPNHWTRIGGNHLNSRECLARVNQFVTKREGLPGCWRRCSLFSFISGWLTFPLRIRRC